MLQAFVMALRGRRMRCACAILCVLPALAGVAVAADPIPPNTVITLQRGACEKRCAVYKVVVFADGTVIYDGQHYVRKGGVVRDKVDIEAVRKLVDDFQSAGFFDLADQYGYASEAGCASMLSDGPLAITSIVSGTKSKAVIHNHRCVAPASALLTRLEGSIDKLVNTARWIR